MQNEIQNFGFADVQAAIKFTTLCPATIYKRIKEGRFPDRVSIGDRRKAWRWSDLLEWSRDPANYKVATE